MGTWHAEIWSLSCITERFWQMVWMWQLSKYNNIQVNSSVCACKCLNFNSCNTATSLETFTTGLMMHHHAYVMKFWLHHGPPSKATKPKFCQVCHSHRGVSNWLKLCKGTTIRLSTILYMVTAILLTVSVQPWVILYLSHTKVFGPPCWYSMVMYPAITSEKQHKTIEKMWGQDNQILRQEIRKVK